MDKLPLGECPGCHHPLWDNDADFKGYKLEQINSVCIYCGIAIRYDVVAGKYIAIDVDTIPLDQQTSIRQAQLERLLIGPATLIEVTLKRRNKDKKTS